MGRITELFIWGGGSTAKTLHMGKNSLYRALDDLIEKGFIERTLEGDWHSQKEGEYRLTFWRDNRANAPAFVTNEWHTWKPGNKQTPNKTSVLK